MKRIIEASYALIDAERISLFTVNRQTRQSTNENLKKQTNKKQTNKNKQKQTKTKQKQNKNKKVQKSPKKSH